MRLLARLPQGDYRTRPQGPGISASHSGVNRFQDETILDILLSSAFPGGLSTGIIGVLDKIGLAEDAPLLYPHLLDAERPRIRLAAAEVLAKIGDAETLEAVEALMPELERLQREDLDRLPRQRERWIREGMSEESADAFLIRQREDRLHFHGRTLRAIDQFRAKIQGGADGLSPGVDGVESGESRAAEGPNRDAMAPRASLPDEVPVAAAVGDSSDEGGKWVAVGLGALVLGILCAWLLVNRRRKEPPTPAPP